MSTKETNPRKVVDPMEIITAKLAAKICGFSERVVMNALRAGDLEGRNMRGRKGWVTTRGALQRWIENGNQGEEG